MNKSFRCFGLIVALLVLGGGLAQAQGRIATVDLVKVFTDYWKTKQSKLALEESRLEIKKEFEAMQEAHKKLTQQFQKLVADSNDQAVSSEEREKRKKALEPRNKERLESEENLKAYYTRNEADLKMKTDRMMETVIKDIKTVVASKARAGGYAYVVDSSAKSLSQTEVFVYASGEADLTDAVVKELNAAAPADFDKAK
ncbi:MAG: OmpH family outer membrane protein [Verrucomicrobiota bacterium]